LPQDAHATGSATAPLAPSIAPFPSAKFRRSAEFIGATDAPMKFSAALHANQRKSEPARLEPLARLGFWHFVGSYGI